MLIFKRVLTLMLGLAVISQLPFAYNRYRTYRLASTIEHLRAERVAPAGRGFRDLKGVFHVHSFLGGHSTGSFDELISAAERDGLDFVVMTEHVSDLYDTAEKTLRGRYGRTLWVGGNELSTTDGDRFLVIDGFEGLSQFQKRSTKDLLDAVAAKGSISVLAYPKGNGKASSGADGIEVLSLNTSAKRMNPILFFFDGLWAYGAYPELTLARYLDRPSKELAVFDRVSSERRSILFAGNDAHSNIGIHLGDDANNRWIDLKYDRYSMIFRLLRTHVLVPEGGPLDRDTILGALKGGNSYVCIDALSDPSGFGFRAVTDQGSFPMGSRVLLSPSGTTLSVELPLKARVILFRNGRPVRDEKDSVGFRHAVRESGAYRVEVYLESLGSPFDKTPWIISNPVFVRKADAGTEVTGQANELK